MFVETKDIKCTILKELQAMAVLLGMSTVSADILVVIPTVFTFGQRS